MADAAASATGSAPRVRVRRLPRRRRRRGPQPGAPPAAAPGRGSARRFPSGQPGRGASPARQRDRESTPSSAAALDAGPRARRCRHDRVAAGSWSRRWCSLIRGYQLLRVAAARPAVPVLPVLLRLRGRGAARPRAVAWDLAGDSSAAALPPVEPRRARSRPAVHPARGDHPTAAAPPGSMEPDCDRPAARAALRGRDLHHGGVPYLVQVVGLDPGSGLAWGCRDRRPGRRDPHPADPAVRQADQRPARPAAPAAGDQEDPDQVQGQDRPGDVGRSSAGDDEALQATTGTNPLASCLPILLQAPIFFALFRVLNGIGKDPPERDGRR